MNQILVTEKIYVTPELKRKKKLYKLMFIISIFLIISLCSVYIYAEYDRNKDESISKNILEFMDEQDNTTISKDENALIVKLTQDATLNADEYEKESEQNANKLSFSGTATSKYTAPDGKEYEYIGRIVIPKIGVDYPILSDTSVELLKVSVCKFHGGNPNEVGNLCIAGHNYRNSRFFSKVDTLSVGDIIEITDLSKRTIQYEIYDIHTVNENDRSDTTQYTNGRKEVTLITCTDDGEQRIIVRSAEKK